MYQIVLDFLHSTSVLSFYIDVVLNLFILILSGMFGFTGLNRLFYVTVHGFSFMFYQVYIVNLNI